MVIFIVAPVDTKGLALAVAVAAIALILIVSQEVSGRRSGPAELLPDPGRRARRRGASYLMLATSLTIALGSWVEPSREARPNLLYVGAWVAVLIEVAALLVIAWRDLAATREIARSRRELLGRENLELLKQELMELKAAQRAERESGNGRPD